MYKNEYEASARHNDALCFMKLHYFSGGSLQYTCKLTNNFVAKGEVIISTYICKLADQNRE